MADLAAFGFAVDSSQVVAADKALGSFATSGKGAQLSADALAATAIRLGISIEEVRRRLAVANDNMANATAQSIRLAEGTRLATAANDNHARSFKDVADASLSTADGFVDTAAKALSLIGHLKLLAIGAYALVPAFRSFVNAGAGKALAVVGIDAAVAVSKFTSILAGLFAILRAVTIPITAAVSAFMLFNAIINTGTGLLVKHGEANRSLYDEDVTKNLADLTKNQGDIISAAQVARATELGARLKDAKFTIDQFFAVSFDLTRPALVFQAIWVNIVELIATGLSSIGNYGSKIISATAAGLPYLNMLYLMKNIYDRFPDDNTDSLKAAKNKLSAIMGVAALGEKDADIGTSFIARFSDNIKKLIDGVDKSKDSWDKATTSINKHMSALIANAASVGKTVEFQEQLRVETQLLESTKGGPNAATDEQIASYVKLRATMDAASAATQSGALKDKDRIKTLTELGEAAGTAKLQFEQLTFAQSNVKALASDAISTKALTAYSPSQKGAIADAQKRLELQDDLIKGIAIKEQIDARAASARKLAIDTEIHQLSEAARARLLAADQTSRTVQVEIDAIGKSAGETYRLTAIEQARQQLQQEASVRHSKIDEAELARLTEKIDKTAKLKQLQAEAQINESISFGRQTAFMSPEDVAIANQLKNIYGNDIPAAMASSQAAAMQLNSAMSQTSGMIVNNLSTAIVDVTMHTKTFGEAFRNLGMVVMRALQEMIIKMLLFRALSAAMSMFGGGGGGGVAMGSSGFGGGGGLEGMKTVQLHSGGMVGINGTPRYVHPAYLENPIIRMHSGGMLGSDERLLIGQTGERMLNRQETANYNRGGSGSQNITVKVINPPGQPAEIASQETKDDGEIILTMRAVARDEQASSRTNAISRQKYGLSPQLKQR